MKIKITKALLENILLKTGKAISTKSFSNILLGVNFVLENDYLTVSSSESDVSIRVMHKVDDINIIGLEPGEFLIKHKLLYNATKKCQSDYITLNTVEQKILKLKSRSINYEFNLMSSEYYPKITFKESKNYIEFNKTDLESIIRHVSFAASSNNQRAILNGINFRSSKGKLYITGTNSHRLAQQIINIDDQLEFSEIIVAKVLTDIFPLIEDENFQIHFLDSSVLFKTSNCLIQIRLLDGIYPNASQIFPSGYTTKIFINKSDFINTLGRALVLSSSNKVIVSLSISKESILIEANETEIGKFSEKISEFEFEGEDIKILLDCGYLLDGLKAFGDNKISIVFNGSSKPVLFEDKGSNSRYIILPIKIN